MNIEKAHWHTEGDNVRVSMPLQKVDQERRIVSGWATLDNADTSSDIVLASASKEAFANFRGNIRLMHQPIPAGRLVDFREDSYYDTETQKFYNGIWVDVYVSKGAENIWEMVLDGTLTGFSIGGKVTGTENHFDKALNKPVRLITKYNLIELSLVDSPANPLCDVVSIQKSADGTVSVTGMAADVVAENVFWCANDKIAFTSQEEAKDCTACGGTTESIGWFESDGGDKTEKVNAIVADFTKTDSVEGRVNKMADDISVSEELDVEAQVEPTPLVVNGDGPTTEAGVALGDDTEGDLEDNHEDAAEQKDELDEEAGEDEVSDGLDNSPLAEVEKAANADPDNDGDDDSDAEGDDDDDADVKKADDEEDADEDDSVQKSIEAIEDLLTKVLDRLAAVESVATRVEEIGQQTDELAEKFSAVSNTVESVQKSYETVEKSVGNKKSGDLGGSTEAVVEKSAKASLWNGRFFGSVNNI